MVVRQDGAAMKADDKEDGDTADAIEGRYSKFGPYYPFSGTAIVASGEAGRQHSLSRNSNKP
jgi:hypothetical protein